MTEQAPFVERVNSGGACEFVEDTDISCLPPTSAQTECHSSSQSTSHSQSYSGQLQSNDATNGSNISLQHMAQNLDVIADNTLGKSSERPAKRSRMSRLLNGLSTNNVILSVVNDMPHLNHEEFTLLPSPTQHITRAMIHGRQPVNYSQKFHPMDEVLRSKPWKANSPNQTHELKPRRCFGFPIAQDVRRSGRIHDSAYSAAYDGNVHPQDDELAMLDIVPRKTKRPWRHSNVTEDANPVGTDGCSPSFRPSTSWNKRVVVPTSDSEEDKCHTSLTLSSSRGSSEEQESITPRDDGIEVIDVIQVKSDADDASQFLAPTEAVVSEGSSSESEEDFIPGNDARNDSSSAIGTIDPRRWARKSPDELDLGAVYNKLFAEDTKKPVGSVHGPSSQPRVIQDEYVPRSSLSVAADCYRVTADAGV